MTRYLISIFVVLASLAGNLLFLPSSEGGNCKINGALQDHTCTPGKPNPILTKDLICSKGFRTGKYRHVTEAEKKKVFAEYNIPLPDHAKYEVDHLISLELGGSNDIENLWPEAYEPRPGAHEKDVVENRLHKAVCSGGMTLEDAQKCISTDWQKCQ